MQVHLTLFGQLAEITGRKEMILQDIPDSETLIKTLNDMYHKKATAC